MKASIDWQRPPVSVCMAAYNGEAHIIRQVRSILNQLTDIDELIISDDGSTDSTPTLIANLNDSRIRFIPNQLGKGIVQNFQNALSLATGDYIFLADQDDIWLTDKITTVCHYLTTADLVLSNCQIINESGEIIHDSFFTYRNSKPGFWRNLLKNPYIGCCMAFRRSVLEYSLPIPVQVHMHDWWIGLLVELKGNVVFIADKTMLYVRHSTNASPTGERSTNSSIKRFSNRFFLLFHLIGRYVKTKADI